jgi:hypothetical protein
MYGSLGSAVISPRFGGQRVHPHTLTPKSGNSPWSFPKIPRYILGLWEILWWEGMHRMYSHTPEIPEDPHPLFLIIVQLMAELSSSLFEPEQISATG